jgi:3-mercaptopyruvate sulfurtransferase SseA
VAVCAVAACALLAGVLLAGCAGRDDAGLNVRMEPLLRAIHLRALLDQHRSLQIVDTRRREAFESEHLPGARSLPAAEIDRLARDGVDVGDLAELAALVRRAGLRIDRPLVVVDNGSPRGFERAALACWAAELLGGGRRCSILEGGIEAWQRGGGATTAEAVPVERKKWALAPPDELPPACAPLADVRRATIAALPALVDVRAPTAVGAIPGARRWPLRACFDEAGTIDRERVQHLAFESGLLVEPEVVVFGHGPGEAAAAWFLLARVLELPQVGAFAGGTARWSTFPELPGAASLHEPTPPDPANAPPAA